MNRLPAAGEGDVRPAALQRRLNRREFLRDLGVVVGGTLAIPAIPNRSAAAGAQRPLESARRLVSELVAAA